MKDLQAQLENIAAQHLRIETLQARNMDSLDFHELSVGSLERALKVAFEAGQAQAHAKRPAKVKVKASAQCQTRPGRSGLPAGHTRAVLEPSQPTGERP